MRTIMTLTILALCSGITIAQHWSPEQLKMIDDSAMISVLSIHSDSTSSSFLIRVRDKVPLHFHAFHTEHVHVLSGRGSMTLGEENFLIGPGDLIVIPAGTAHDLKVTSEEPVRVISILTPFFNGTDRIFITPEDVVK